MKLRPFELALVIIFVILAIFALIMLKTYTPSAPEQAPDAVIGKVTIWGTFPADAVNASLVELREAGQGFGEVNYTYINQEQFDNTLLNALADNLGPDVVLLPHEKLVEMRRRIQPISYDSFPLRDIKNTYIDGAQIFALPDGFYGMPIAVDPLMMYWNRDILATKGFLSPPATWEELINTQFPELVVRDYDRTVTRSVVAMGQYTNVRNSFGIISMLLTQGGSERVVVNDQGEYSIRLQNSLVDTSNPFVNAVDFYTRFSRPSNALYSWNRAFQEDRQQFIAEDLVFYFGLASEGPQIEKINPNLNFDIAEVPQGADATIRRTYGTFYAFSVLRSSDNAAAAAQAAFQLGSGYTAEKLAVAANMAPVFRSSIAAGSNDTYGRVSYKSALTALGWLNPDIEASEQFFATMVQDINENRNTVDGAVSDAASRLQDFY